MFDSVPDGFTGQYVYGYLMYNSASGLPSKAPMANLDTFDDMDLVMSTANKWDEIETLSHVDHSLVLNADFASLYGGINR